MHFLDENEFNQASTAAELHTHSERGLATTKTLCSIAKLSAIVAEGFDIPLTSYDAVPVRRAIPKVRTACMHFKIGHCVPSVCSADFADAS